MNASSRPHAPRLALLAALWLALVAGLGWATPARAAEADWADAAQHLSANAKVTATPTIRLNGQDISPATPDELLAKIRAVVGPLPALAPAPASPAPAAPAPVAP